MSLLVLCVPLLDLLLGDTSNEVWLRVAHAQLAAAAGAALRNCSQAGGQLWPAPLTPHLPLTAPPPSCADPATWALPVLLGAPGVVSALRVLASLNPTLLSLSINGTAVPQGALAALGVSAGAIAPDASALRASELDPYSTVSWLYANGSLAAAAAASGGAATPFTTYATWSLRADVRNGALLDLAFSAAVLGVLTLGAVRAGGRAVLPPSTHSQAAFLPDRSSSTSRSTVSSSAPSPSSSTSCAASPPTPSCASSRRRRSTPRTAAPAAATPRLSCRHP